MMNINRVTIAIFRTENPCVPGSIPGDTTEDKTLKIRLLISLQTVKVQHKTLKKSDVLHFFVSDYPKLHHFACKIPAICSPIGTI